MIAREKLEQKETARLFEDSAGMMMKLAVDIERGVLSAGCELHVDCADELLEDGSRKEDLWGANFYRDGRVDFISLLNIRPKDGNRSMEIQDEGMRQKVEKIIRALL